MVRPTFKPTTAQKRQVAIGAGGGMSHEEIATVLNISRNTLEKHFAVELSIGSATKRMEVLAAMHTAAKKGNVAAQKAYLAFTPTTGASPAPPDEPRPAKLVPKGKKEIAQEEALVAQTGTDWESLLPGPLPVQ